MGPWPGQSGSPQSKCGKGRGRGLIGICFEELTCRSSCPRACCKCPGPRSFDRRLCPAGMGVGRGTRPQRSCAAGKSGQSKVEHSLALERGCFCGRAALFVCACTAIHNTRSFGSPHHLYTRTHTLAHADAGSHGRTLTPAAEARQRPGSGCIWTPEIMSSADKHCFSRPSAQLICDTKCTATLFPRPCTRLNLSVCIVYIQCMYESTDRFVCYAEFSFHNCVTKKRSEKGSGLRKTTRNRGFNTTTGNATAIA